MLDFDWSHLQSFAAVAKHGSLSAAARATGSSQPTMSRHIAQLEADLGARVFERSKAGVLLTSKGVMLLDHVNAMADAAARMAMAHAGTSADLAGTVRLTASCIVATYVLPSILVDLHHKHPDIQIELVSSDDTKNLLWREADIAVRMYRPTQQDVIAQKVGDLDMAAYASTDYAARHGLLEDPAAILEHDLVGYDRSTAILDGLQALGLKPTREDFAFRSDDQVVCWQMVRAGMGIGFNQTVVGDMDPSVVRMTGDTPVASLPIWLTAHPELPSSPRVRRVFDHLKAGLRNWTRHGPDTPDSRASIS